jgi:hypothetical protein
METFDDMKNVWNKGRSEIADSAALDWNAMDKYIAAGMKKVRSSMMKFFWGTFVYHIVIYALLTHVFIRSFGDGKLMFISLAGILLYAPFTAFMIKKFKMMCNPDSDSGKNVKQFLSYQHKQLNDFYRFKKWFDWLGVPATALILVLIIFSLYVTGGPVAHPVAIVLSTIAVIAVLVPFIRSENLKGFVEPLNKLESLIDDMDKSTELQVPDQGQGTGK